MNVILAVAPGPKDVFKLIGDVGDVEKLSESLKTTDEDDEYHVSYSDTGFEDGPYSQQQRDGEVAELDALIAKLRDETYLQSILERLPKKKNGTLHKNRQVHLFRAQTNSQLAVEWFGWFADEVNVKAISDYEAELTVSRVCEKWS